jgi:hypothetical protein
MDATAQHVTLRPQQGPVVLRLGKYLLILPLPFLLFFLAALFGVLRRVHGSNTLGVAAVTAGTAVAVVWPLSAVVNTIAIAEAGGDAATIIAFDAIGPYALALSAVLLLATAGCCSIISARRDGSRGRVSCWPCSTWWKRRRSWLATCFRCWRLARCCSKGGL